MQKYPRGSRGSPAKGVVWETVARVRISSSAPKNAPACLVRFLACMSVRTCELPRVRARGGKDGEAFLPFVNLAPLLCRLRQYVVFCALACMSVKTCELPRVRARGGKDGETFLPFVNRAPLLCRLRQDVVFCALACISVRTCELPRVRARGGKGDLRELLLRSYFLICLYQVRVEFIYCKKWAYQVRVEIFLFLLFHSRKRLKNREKGLQIFAFCKKIC